MGEVTDRKLVSKGDVVMVKPQAEGPLSEQERREVFRALVEAQDQGMHVAQSRAAIAERYGIEEDLVREIEREGLDHDWPPL
jgi:hypothetical protein